MINPKSTLLLIDGCPETLYAAQLCSELASRSSGEVTALHVINTDLIREMFDFTTPGLVGSGPYISACEETRLSLRKVAEAITDSYSTKFSSIAGRPGAVLVEEGNPAEVIEKIYRQYDLIVMGHRPLRSRSKFHQSTSLCQALANDGAKPIVVVQKNVHEFSKLRLFIGDPVPPLACLQDILDFAKTVCLEPAFSWVGTEEGFEQLSHLVGQRVPGIDHTAVYFTNVEHPLLDRSARVDIQIREGELPIFFTRKILTGRFALQGEYVTNLLLDLDLPAYFLWPIEPYTQRQQLLPVHTAIALS